MKPRSIHDMATLIAGRLMVDANETADIRLLRVTTVMVEPDMKPIGMTLVFKCGVAEFKVTVMENDE